MSCTKLLYIFGSTDLCEQLFSLMKLNKSKLKSQLTDEHFKKHNECYIKHEVKIFHQILNIR